MTRTRAHIHKTLAKRRAALNHGIVVSLRDPEFPPAQLLPRSPRWELVRWLIAKWAWVRPRTIPLLVAAAAAVFLVVSADYLAHGHGSLHTINAFK
jgi:hypothetical protein